MALVTVKHGFKYCVFVQDISKAQRIVTTTKSPMNVRAMSREEGGAKVCQMEKVSPDSSTGPLFDLGLVSLNSFPEQRESQMKESHPPRDTLTAVHWKQQKRKYKAMLFWFNKLTDMAPPEPPLLKIFIVAVVAGAITDSLHALHFTAISLCSCRLEVTASRIRRENQSWEAKSYQNHSRCVLPQPVWK